MLCLDGVYAPRPDESLRCRRVKAPEREELEDLVEQIAAALPEGARQLIVELADNHARHVWMQQEGAYYLGLAVARRLARRNDAG